MITFTMKTTNPSNSKPAGANDYEGLLVAAQAAQAAADRAVADLAALKRTLVEAPRITELRREELARAQAALEQAEAQLAEARAGSARKQAEAARLIEAAADAQRALAQALITQDVIPDAATLGALSHRFAAAAPASPVPAAPAPGTRAASTFDATLGRNRYTATPSMHPADLHAEVVDYLQERDALCPSCGHSLRGITSARCPDCKLQLSVNVLRSVRASPMQANFAVWVIRALAGFGGLMSAYLAFVVATGRRPFLCGVHSDCHFAIISGWSKLAGIPAAAFAVPIYLGLLLSTGFIHIGLTDTTRRRARAAMIAFAAAAGFAGIWFLFVQLVLIKAICPHCLLVNLSGIAAAAMVVWNTRMGRGEPAPAGVSRINLSRGACIGVTAAAACLVGVIATGQMLTTGQYPQPDRASFGRSKTPQKKSGLLMKGLDTKAPVDPADAPPPPLPDGGRGLLIPALDSAREPQRPPVKQEPAETPSEKKPQDAEHHSDASDATPDAAEADGDADSDNDKKKDPAKPQPRFDFSDTLPPSRE